MKQQTISHIITAHDLRYITDQRYQELCDLGRETERTLNVTHSFPSRPLNDGPCLLAYLSTCLPVYLSTE